VNKRCGEEVAVVLKWLWSGEEDNPCVPLYERRRSPKYPQSFWKIVEKLQADYAISQYRAEKVYCATRDLHQGIRGTWIRREYRNKFARQSTIPAWERVCSGLTTGATTTRSIKTPVPPAAVRTSA
jgi:hypothetical protein